MTLFKSDPNTSVYNRSYVELFRGEKKREAKLSEGMKEDTGRNGESVL